LLKIFLEDPPYIQLIGIADQFDIAIGGGLILRRQSQQVVEADRFLDQQAFFRTKMLKHPLFPNHLHPQPGMVIGIAVAKGSPAPELGKTSGIVQDCHGTGDTGFFHCEELTGCQGLHRRYNPGRMLLLQEDVLQPFRVQIKIPADMEVKPCLYGNEVFPGH
jgi:hypothetical protein